MKESLAVEVAAVIVAVLAAIIAVWNGYLTRKHNRLSVRPRLRLSHRYRGSTNYYGVRIINAGLGPGVIRYIRISLDGKPLDNTHAAWKKMIEDVGLTAEDWHITRLGPDSVLRPNDEVWIFRADRLPVTANIAIRAFSRATLEVGYASMYDEFQPPLKDGIARLDLVVEAEDKDVIKSLPPTA